MVRGEERVGVGSEFLVFLWGLRMLQSDRHLKCYLVIGNVTPVRSPLLDFRV